MEVCGQWLFMATASSRGPATLRNINKVPPRMVIGEACRGGTGCPKAWARNYWASWENVFSIYRCRKSESFHGKIMNAFKTCWGQSFFWEEMKKAIRPKGKTKMGFWGCWNFSFQSCHSMFEMPGWVRGRERVYSSKSKITDFNSWVTDFAFSYNLHSQFTCNSPSGKF